MFIKKVLFFGIIILAVLSPLAAQSPETLAVLDFTTEAVSKTDMKAIVEFMSAELFKTRRYTVIDVSQRETILNEMKFSISGCSDDSCALEIGKLLSAEIIVVGNLSQIGSRFLLSVKMLETETSRTMGTANGKYKDLDELIDGLNSIVVSLAVEESKTKEAEASEIITFETELKQNKPETYKDTAPEAETEINVSSSPELEKSDRIEIAGGQEPAEPEKTAPKQEPIEIDTDLILPLSFTAGGVIGIGAGTYFIIRLFSTSIPDYLAARTSYTEAIDVGSSEITALYEASESNYNLAINDLIIGSSVSAAGVILTIVGVLLFPPSDDADNAISFQPSFSGNPGLVVRVSY